MLLLRIIHSQQIAPSPDKNGPARDAVSKSYYPPALPGDKFSDLPSGKLKGIKNAPCIAFIEHPFFNNNLLNALS